MISMAASLWRLVLLFTPLLATCTATVDALADAQPMLGVHSDDVPVLVASATVKLAAQLKSLLPAKDEAKPTSLRLSALRHTSVSGAAVHTEVGQALFRLSEGLEATSKSMSEWATSDKRRIAQTVVGTTDEYRMHHEKAKQSQHILDTFRNASEQRQTAFLMKLDKIEATRKELEAEVQQEKLKLAVMKAAKLKADKLKKIQQALERNKAAERIEEAQHQKMVDKQTLLRSLARVVDAMPAAPSAHAASPVHTEPPREPVALESPATKEIPAEAAKKAAATAKVSQPLHVVSGVHDVPGVQALHAAPRVSRPLHAVPIVHATPGVQALPAATAAVHAKPTQASAAVAPATTKQVVAKVDGSDLKVSHPFALPGDLKVSQPLHLEAEVHTVPGVQGLKAAPRVSRPLHAVTGVNTVPGVQAIHAAPRVSRPLHAAPAVHAMPGAQALHAAPAVHAKAAPKVAKTASEPNKVKTPPAAVKPVPVPAKPTVKLSEHPAIAAVNAKPAVHKKQEAVPPTKKEAPHRHALEQQASKAVVSTACQEGCGNANTKHVQQESKTVAKPATAAKTKSEKVIEGIQADLSSYLAEPTEINERRPPQKKQHVTVATAPSTTDDEDDTGYSWHPKAVAISSNLREYLMEDKK